MKIKFLDFLFGYEATDERFEDSNLKKVGKKFSDRVISGIGSAYSKRVFSSPFVSFITRLRSSLAGASVKSYGILFLAFGLMTLLANFAEYYFRDLPESPAFELVVGIAFAAAAIPLLFINTPLADFLERFSFTDKFLFEFLCLRRSRSVRTYGQKSEFSWLIPLFAAAALAAFGFIFPLYVVLIAAPLLILLALMISSPEFSMMLTLMALPIVPLIPGTTFILAALIGICAVSFFIKVLLGKRLFHFEQYDAAMLLFMLFILISGVFNKGIVSFENSLSLVVLGVAYFLVSNILVNRRLTENAVNMIILSSVPTAVYGIVTYYSSAPRPEWTDPMFTGISARAYSTFANPNVYAVFLIVAVIFSLAFALDKSRKKASLIYAVIAILNIFVLVLTMTRGAWIAVILAALAFVIIKSRRCPKLLLLPVLAIPVALVFIPGSITERFLSIFSMQDSSSISRLSIWRSSLSMFAENLFIGIGVGSGAFSEEFTKYAEDSVTAPHSHNVFLEIGCEMGIFALILFVFILLIRIRHRASYAKYVRNSSVGSLCTMSGTAFFALLIFGMSDYIWYSAPMYVLFWVVFGIGSATLRISKKEHDDSLVATPAEAEDYSAQINITIEKGSDKRDV